MSSFASRSGIFKSLVPGTGNVITMFNLVAMAGPLRSNDRLFDIWRVFGDGNWRRDEVQGRRQVFAASSLFSLCSLCPLWLLRELNHKGHKEHKAKSRPR